MAAHGKAISGHHGKPHGGAHAGYHGVHAGLHHGHAGAAHEPHLSKPKHLAMTAKSVTKAMARGKLVEKGKPSHRAKQKFQ